ncbi:hypothetical protein J1TS5_10060 [Paenibacillus macerans]|nr:hypothetical protein J1TS5_10060 [Paenibacillus macerans]
MVNIIKHIRWGTVILIVTVLFLFRVGGAVEAAPTPSSLYLVSSATVAKASNKVPTDKPEPDEGKQEEPEEPEESDDSDSPKPDEEEDDESDDSDSGGLFGWAKKLIKKIDAMLQTFQDLMSGKLIYDAIQGLTVRAVDEIVAPLYGAFAKSYLFTPQLAEIDVIYKGWSIVMALGLAALILGVIWLTFSVIRGQKSLNKLLQAFLICLPIVFFSLTMLNILNVLANWLTQNMLEGVIGTSGISYQGLTGEEILKAFIVGADAITDSVYAAQSLGNVVVQSPGGMFMLVTYLAFVIVPLWLVSVFKTLILMALVVFFPAWIAYIAYTGKTETLAGFGNLYIRTLLVGFFSALHFGVFVRMQTDYGTGTGIAAELGVSPIIFAILSVIALLVFLYFFHWRSVWRAIKDPMQLGGGNVVERVGQWGERVSLAVNMLGKRFGANGLQKRSLSWAEKSRRMQEVGKKMQAQQGSTKAPRALSKLTKGASEAMQGVTYTPPTVWATETGTISANEVPELELGLSQIDTSSTNIHDILTNEQGFTPAKYLPLNAQQRTKMQKLVKNLDARYKENVYLTSKGLYVTGDSDQTTNALYHLKSLGVQVEKMGSGLGKEGVFVDLKDRSIHVLDDYQETQDVVDKIQEELPTHSPLILDANTAQRVYNQLMERESELPWVKELKWTSSQGAIIPSKDGNNQFLDLGQQPVQLLVPDDHMKKAKPYIEKMLSKQKSSVRLDLPRGSRFLETMIQDWEKSGQHSELLKALEPVPKQNCVYVQKESKEDFMKAYEAYRKDRKPFWRTQSGQIKVIIDGVPVDHGAPPLDGLDMGSFEAFQKEMFEKRQASAAKTSPQSPRSEERKKGKGD